MGGWVYVKGKLANIRQGFAGHVQDNTSSMNIMEKVKVDSFPYVVNTCSNHQPSFHSMS